MDERILCAAIWFNDGHEGYVHQPKNIKSGYVICGRRHHNIFTIRAMLVGLTTERNRIDDVTQGFLTDADRFVDRDEAFQIAKLGGQIKFNGRAGNGKELYSEDLY